MAKTTSKTFSILALLLTVLLIGTAGVVYLQSLSAGGGGGNTALAALSQAMPSHAANAAAGVPQGFEQLDSDVKRLQRLTSAAGSSLPGSRAQWQVLQQSADALLATLADAESTGLAIAFLEQHVPLLESASSELLEQSGATSVIQEFRKGPRTCSHRSRRWRPATTYRNHRRLSRRISPTCAR